MIGRNTNDMANLRLDRTSKKVFIGKSIINLDPQEFEILWFLANKPGYKYSPDQLCASLFPVLGLDKERILSLAHRLRFKMGERWINCAQEQVYFS